MCRMGYSAEHSVIDPFVRSHGLKNLWIYDHSVFPGSLAANPALTIMALGLRTPLLIDTPTKAVAGLLDTAAPSYSTG
jgi:choline dehydrogenase-like flavoprotein